MIMASKIPMRFILYSMITISVLGWAANTANASLSFIKKIAKQVIKETNRDKERVYTEIDRTIDRVGVVIKDFNFPKDFGKLQKELGELQDQLKIERPTPLPVKCKPLDQSDVEIVLSKISTNILTDLLADFAIRKPIPIAEPEESNFILFSNASISLGERRFGIVSVDVYDGIYKSKQYGEQSIGFATVDLAPEVVFTNGGPHLLIRGRVMNIWPKNGVNNTALMICAFQIAIRYINDGLDKQALYDVDLAPLLPCPKDRVISDVAVNPIAGKLVLQIKYGLKATDK